MQNIVVVDYGLGNLRSVEKALRRITPSVTVSSAENDIMKASKLILPGVGHFLTATYNLKRLKLWEALDQKVRVECTPILGICLGMQLFAAKSQEGNAEGFGWIEAECMRLKVDDPIRYKIPHMGWNTLSASRDNALLKGISESASFYFVHAYHVACKQANDVVAHTEYGQTFVSILQHKNIYGVQFHPEKSRAAGERMLRNFLDV